MPDEKQIQVFLNPLQFHEVDEPWASIDEKELSPTDILNFICIPGIGSDTESLIQRYKEISIEKIKLIAAPYEQRILDKLVWPLRNAKAAYMCGNYLSTIALCGMVTEMVAILLFEISGFQLNNKPMSDKDQNSVFGRKFEKLGQMRRVSILAAYSIIDSDILSAFESIRIVRNRYLHLWSQDHDQLPIDAVQSYKSAVQIVVAAIGQNIKEGKLILNQNFVKYLKRKGIYKEDNEAQQACIGDDEVHAVPDT
ncbi:hypothetical protein [uncultured Desulfosarcina sp.]|uniref:hypothetical protein n=1 Tax=uncultured Desulfosarcina sp. TaxID=218289 RepID=UPI0029C849EC|nr:hypothetical protein [uncultured Desulfosarcina sp.]